MVFMLLKMKCVALTIHLQRQLKYTRYITVYGIKVAAVYFNDNTLFKTNWKVYILMKYTIKLLLEWTYNLLLFYKDTQKSFAAEVKGE